MRTAEIEFSITLNFPCDKPDKNGNCYTRDAVERALSAIGAGLPVIKSSNSNSVAPKVIGCTTSSPYAVQFDKDIQAMRCNIDGVILFGGTDCIVNEKDADGKITDFIITSIGISE